MTSNLIRACCLFVVPALACAWSLQGSAASALHAAQQGSTPKEQAQAETDGWPTAPGVPAGDSTVDAGISAGELRGHVQALSHDSLAGRPMGSDESLVAAKYVAERLAAMGVKPGAADGTYLQRIELYKEVYAEPSELRVVTTNGEETTLLYGEGFTFSSSAVTSDTGALRCMNIAKESDLPAVPNPTVALVFQTSSGKARRWLRNAGADKGAGYGLVIFPRKKSELGSVETKLPTRWATVASASGGISAKIKGPWGARAYNGEWDSVHLVPRCTIERSHDVNVIGKVMGAGTAAAPELKDEIVMLAAHRDHIGLYQPREGQEIPEDVIRNGADDDASGCSVVLEVLEALAHGEQPARTVVGVFVTGEEVGMVGSRFWAQAPTEEPTSVVCALNFEMLGRPDPLTDGPGNIWLTGYERSNLGPVLREHGIEVTPDVRPSQNFFVRSDNVSFAKIGIVSQTLSSFGGHGDYHRVTDEWDTLDYDHMEAAAAISLATVLDLASGTWKPAWNEGEPKF